MFVPTIEDKIENEKKEKEMSKFNPISFHFLFFFLSFSISFQITMKNLIEKENSTTIVCEDFKN